MYNRAFCAELVKSSFVIVDIPALWCPFPPRVIRLTSTPTTVVSPRLRYGTFCHMCWVVPPRCNVGLNVQFNWTKFQQKRTRMATRDRMSLKWYECPARACFHRGWRPVEWADLWRHPSSMSCAGRSVNTAVKSTQCRKQYSETCLNSPSTRNEVFTVETTLHLLFC